MRGRWRHEIFGTPDRILWEIMVENPAYGPVLMSRYDTSDGFYCVYLNMEGIPKLGVAFTLHQVPSFSDLPASSPNGLEKQSTRILYSH